MTTDKTNQHYIPKFYLRLFSHQGNQKQIGLFNLQNQFFFDRAKLKTQASKKFLYGNDGIIENDLMLIESLIAPTIQNISRNHTLPALNSSEHKNLLYFISLTVQRNPISINYPKDTRKQMRALIEAEFGPGEDIVEQIPEANHEEALKLSLSNIQLIVDLINKMHYKLFINETKLPFITSDYPIVRYNQFLESKKWIGGDAGFGNIGLQIIIPIDSKVLVFMYDQVIYKVGKKRNNNVFITDEETISSLNLLQFLNCSEQVFFNHSCNKAYLLNLFKQSKKYVKANQPHSSLGHLLTSNGKVERNSILRVGATNLRIKLRLEHVKLTKQGRRQELNRSMAQTRKNIDSLLRF